MAGAAACLLAGLVYPLIFLLPPAAWVLPAADSYSHYVTLPIGLWTLAALIELAERSLPSAEPASSLENVRFVDQGESASLPAEPAVSTIENADQA